jgi:hypothetical protein
LNNRNPISIDRVHDAVFDSAQSAIEYCREIFTLHISNNYPLLPSEVKFWEDYLSLIESLILTDEIKIKYETILCIFEELKNI